MTEEKQTQAEHLAKNLKKKKVRKYVLIALALAALAYTISIFTDDDFAIQKITALKCERLGGDDARGSTYRGKRTDEYDYYRLDCILEEAVCI